MKRFLRDHEEWVLAFGGFAISALILISMVWGITSVSRVLGTAANSKSGADAKIEFNLEKASKLDYRGLSN